MTDDLKTRVEKILDLLPYSEKAQSLITDLYAEVQRLKERLEEGYGFDINGTRVECPDIPDGIFARDCTIEVLEEENKMLKEENQKLEQENAALREAGTNLVRLKNNIDNHLKGSLYHWVIVLGNNTEQALAAKGGEDE